MQITKVFLFVCSFFLIGAFSVSAYATATSQVTIDVIEDACPGGQTNPPECNKFITPDLKVTAVHDYVSVVNSDGPIYVSYDIYNNALVDYTLSWQLVKNATSCTLDGVVVSPTGQSIPLQTKIANQTKEHKLTCWSPTIAAESDTLIIGHPPKIENLKYQCNATNTLAKFIWDKPAGINAYYVRASSEKGGYSAEPSNDHTVVYNDNWIANNYDMSVNPNEKYDFWVHSTFPNINGGGLAFGPENKIAVSCVPVTPEGEWVWDYVKACIPACESSCKYTITQSCTIPGHCKGVGKTDEKTVVNNNVCKYEAKIWATPVSIREGGATTVNWISNDMTSCQGTSKDPKHLSWNALEDGKKTGSFMTNLWKSTTYYLKCLATDSTGKLKKSIDSEVQVHVDRSVIEEI